MGEFSHFDAAGASRMVDVGKKQATRRLARASGVVQMAAQTLAFIRDKKTAKGDVLAVAQVAGVMGAKRTPELIPMCHPLLLSRIDVAFQLGEDTVSIRATVANTGQTGVEMEALTAVAAAALTIYDMVKAVDRGMVIEQIQLERKEGGRGGVWERA